MSNFAIGVDLGGTNLRIAAVDAQGQLMEKLTLGTKTILGRDHVLNDMCGAIRQVSDKYKASGNLLGVGIGVPGIIDMQTGMVRESANLPGWSDYPVRAEIERRLGATVILENDANVAAFGEKWLGAGRHVGDMAMLTLGTGVGGGLVLNGKIWHGMTGMAGEFGHMTVDPEGQLCGCGNHGCLEQYASATAIRRLAAEAIGRGEYTALNQLAGTSQELTAEAVFQAALRGDRVARQIFDTAGSALGIALANLINVLNLPLYVIGGGLSQAWDVFSPALFRELKNRSIVFRTRAQKGQRRDSPIISPTRL